VTLGPSNLVQAATGTTGGAQVTGFTATWAAAAAGNTLILIVGASATVATPSGWTLDQAEVDNDGHYVFRKTAAGGETSQAVTLGATRQAAWVLIEVSGLDATQPDVAPASTGSGTAVASRSTGTSGPTSQGDVLCLASWVSIANPPQAITAATNSFAPLADTGATTFGNADDVRLQVYRLFPGAVGSYESTGTFAADSISTAIIAIYRGAAGVDATVTVPAAAAATADLPAPSVSAAATLIAPAAATSTADMPAPAVSAGATITAPAMTATATMPAAAFGAARDLDVVLGSPLRRWTAGPPRRRWFAGPPR